MNDLRVQPAVLRFKLAGEQFCRHFESTPSDANEWVTSLLGALAELYAAAHELPEIELPYDASDIPDSLDVSDEDWKQVYEFVQKILGTQTLYWAYFDPSQPIGAS